MISKNQIKLVRSLEQKKYRLREGLFVAEGPKVVGDLLASGFSPRQLFATAEWNGGERSLALPLQDVSGDELHKLSFLQHPQQVLALFELPAPLASASSALASAPSSLFLALDGVQDPGNLGTIIRLADWFGINTVFCSEDTADAFSPKVVQATMGSIARVHVTYADLKSFLSKSGLPVFGTLLDGDNIYQQHLPDRGIIVMGNEGNGISMPIRKLVTHKLLIPKFREGPESLNVAIATAIVCSEFRRCVHADNLYSL